MYTRGKPQENFKLLALVTCLKHSIHVSRYYAQLWPLSVYERCFRGFDHGESCCGLYVEQKAFLRCVYCHLRLTLRTRYGKRGNFTRKPNVQEFQAVRFSGGYILHIHAELQLIKSKGAGNNERQNRVKYAVRPRHAELVSK